MTFKIVIPARYKSSRLEGKSLLDIAGMPMIIHVVKQSLKSNASEVIVATDDQRIFDVVEEASYKSIMTDVQHKSGTERVAEVVNKMNWSDNEIIVNVQGDEPLINPSLINQVAECLNNKKDVFVSTLCHLISDYDYFINPNNVKVVLDKDSNAMYFSRAPIPFPRDEFNKKLIKSENFYQHIGIYAYRAKFLKNYRDIKRSDLESIEKLEQLSILYAGFKIGVVKSLNAPIIGVDTAEDLEVVRKLFSNLNS
ncbi:MAG: 3-deoxy-manno-octulosonate cytidylyltransferase [Candidatus Methylopumilus sp.]|nr:3-deoxy-manno-octulosonate cytidylyltransferase [Candidatus Methylopumilus sp.]